MNDINDIIINRFIVGKNKIIDKELIKSYNTNEEICTLLNEFHLKNLTLEHINSLNEIHHQSLLKELKIAKHTIKQLKFEIDNLIGGEKD